MIYGVIDRETISSVSSATGFTASKLAPTGKIVHYAVIQAIDADIRFTTDGTTPTSSLGLRLTQDSSVEIWGTDALLSFLAIDDGGTAKVEVIFMGTGGK